MENKFNDRNIDSFDGVGPFTAIGADFDPSLAGDFRDLFYSAPNEGDWRGVGEGFIPDDLDIPALCQEPSLDFEELGNPEKDSISVALKRFKGAGRQAKAAVDGKDGDYGGYLTFEDYEAGPEQDAFLIIYGQAVNLFEPKNVDVFNSALDFFFCPSETLNFDDAAAILSNEIRTDVFRLRIIYQWWSKNTVLPQMPFMTAVLPNRVENHASRIGDLPAIMLCRHAWFHPSIDESDLIDRVLADLQDTTYRDLKGPDLLKILSQLESEWVISRKFSFLYTTGCNLQLMMNAFEDDPELRSVAYKRSYWWSRLFT